MRQTPPIRVLIVDDSRTIRQLFKQFLGSDPAIEVIGCAEDPHEARALIKQLNPDVITLDIEMPKMDGLSFLDKIMTLRPMPVVMVSTLTLKGAQATIRALETGAVDYISKPVDLAALGQIQGELLRKVKQAARAKVKAKMPQQPINTQHFTGDGAGKLIAIGASTGGVEAIRALLSMLPSNLPPIVITQHMPATFTGAFAQRLNGLLPMQVQEVKHNETLTQGYVYIASGAEHFHIVEQTGKLKANLRDGAPVSGHKPSVDVMFESIAQSNAPRSIAALLTGMGKDGAQGLKALRDAGATTLGQSEASCIVYGMPKAAMKLGATQKELSLEAIAQEIVSFANN